MAMEIYTKYQPTTVLDFCAGWGGRLVGACALNIKEYIGIEMNTDIYNVADKRFKKVLPKTIMNRF